MTVRSNKEMKGKKGTSPRRKSVFVNEPSHCCVHSPSRLGICERACARDGVCVWITLGGRRPSEGFCCTSEICCCRDVDVIVRIKRINSYVCNYDDDFKGLKWGFYFRPTLRAYLSSWI
jgi:hypothetical protein